MRQYQNVSHLRVTLQLYWPFGTTPLIATSVFDHIWHRVCLSSVRNRLPLRKAKGSLTETSNPLLLKVSTFVTLFCSKAAAYFSDETALSMTSISPLWACIIYHFIGSSWGCSKNRCVKWWTAHDLLAWNQDVIEGTGRANCILTAEVTMEALTLCTPCASLAHLTCAVHFNCYGWSVFHRVKSTCPH